MKFTFQYKYVQDVFDFYLDISLPNYSSCSHLLYKCNTHYYKYCSIQLWTLHSGLLSGDNFSSQEEIL
jgi:hypothetical protein